MTLETTVRESCAGLVSLRANERKKSAEGLKDFLMRNAVPSLLSENTKRKNGYSWNDVFVDINDYILKETEKFESSKNFDNVTAPLCTSLLHLCVAGSNKGQAYIKCERVIESCLFVLKDARLTKAIGDAYLNLLYKYVMTCDYYVSYITPNNWEDLLDVCISACLRTRSKLDDFTKLRLVWLVIKNAIKCCQFIIPLRDSLSKLKKCFLFINDKKVQEVVTEIMILLLEMLSSECRQTMCEFTESVLTSTLKFYDQNIDQKKKMSLFKSLQMMVMLHHPNGRLQRDEGSLANNWTIWNKQLHSILEIVTLEASFLQRHRKQNDTLMKPNSYYYSLSSSVYYQIFNLPDNIEEDSANSSKRQKVSLNKNKIFRDLIDELSQNCTPWLGILHAYIKSYGNTIPTEDYLSLINIIESLVTGNNVSINWDIFEEITCFILKYLSSFSSTNAECSSMVISLWNSCVRNSTSASVAHKALHTIMNFLLTFDTVKYHHVQPLIKMYFENGMPVTEHSLNTLNHLFQKYFSKCSYVNERIKCFTWLTQGNITSPEVTSVKELLLRLISIENIPLAQQAKKLPECGILNDIIFNSFEKCTLFSDFEYEIPHIDTPNNEHLERFEISVEVNREIQGHFETKLLEHIAKIKSKDMELFPKYIKFLSVVLAYIDILIKYTEDNTIKDLELFKVLRSAIQLTFVSITDILKKNTQATELILLLNDLQPILNAEYDRELSSLVRQSINNEFFHCINNVIYKETSADDEIIFEEDDVENPRALKHKCIIILAAYCRKQEDYTDELLELILDHKLYTFTSYWDVQCSLQCIELLNSSGEKHTLDPSFKLLQYMCKVLFRDPNASFSILKVLVKSLERFWAHGGDMKQNCFIMVNGYLHRCEQSYYPPQVAALIYECAAKVILLNDKENIGIDEALKEVLINRMKGDVHSIRLYCCYMLKNVTDKLTEVDIELYLEGLLDIFIIKVSEREELILKDESTNRTQTLLHGFLALVQSKKSLIDKIVTSIIQFQKEKSLDESLLRKVLNKIAHLVTKRNIEDYLNDNILFVLSFWFTNNNTLNEFPIYLFGFSKMNSFLEKHVKWIVSSDILWHNEGNLRKSDVLKQVANKAGKTEDDIIEICFCNITVLCLPYIVMEKYKMEYIGGDQTRTKMISNATKLLQSTRQVLGSDKWTNLFIENMGDLLLFAASHLNDCSDSEEKFNVKLPKQIKTYQYPKIVFLAILKYFGELIDGNIMQYLCENQPSAIFTILFKLWEKVLKENVFEFKVLALNSYITFIESIPLGYSPDAFICNFVCNSIAHAIKDSGNKEEIKLLVEGLRIILSKMLPEKAIELRKSASQVISILIIKKEEGFQNECEELLNFLVIDMKDYLKESEDVIDFVSSLSQGVVDNVNCSTKTEFMTKLQTYNLSLTCPSYETLLNMRKFIQINKSYVNNLCDGLSTQGFSEDCGTSVIHQVIYELNNILKSASDDKTKIEACNCLAEIGIYDLKTLVTVPPADTRNVINIKPTQYFAIVVVSALSEVMFDKEPSVTNKVAKCLNRIFKYREGKTAFELGEVDKDTLKCFLSSECNAVSEFDINGTKFNSYSALDFWIPKRNETHSQWVIRITLAILDVFASTTNYINSLYAVCVSKYTVCRNILPALVGLLIYYSSENHVDVISEQIKQFFKYIWDLSFDEKVENSGDSSVCKKTWTSLDQDHKMIIQYVLDVVDFVRLQRKLYKTRPDRQTDTFNYLKLEYDKVAWAATVTEQNLSAIYYGELWATALNGSVPPSSPEATTLLNGGENVQRIFKKCYVSIGEMDAIDGCGTAHLTIEDEKRKHLINTGQYSDALLLHDIALSCGQTDDLDLQYGVVRSLHKSGMHHLALQYIKSLPENEELNEIKYECLSFLGDWNNFIDTRDLDESCKQPNSNLNSIIKAYRYACLRDCLNLQTTLNFENKLTMPLNSARLAVTKLCQNLNMTNCQSVYKVVSRLHLFNDIEDYFSVRCDKLSISELLSRWQVRNLPAHNDFKHLEALISQRSLILEHASKSNNHFLKEIVCLQLNYAELGLSNQRIQMAQRLLATAKKLHSSEEAALVEGKIAWAKGHKDIARSLLRGLVTKDCKDAKLTAVSLRQYGLWMAESKCDNTRDIINKYLKKSLDVLNKSQHADTRLKVYYDIAKFADAEYKQVVAYMNSSVFENKVKCLEDMKGTASSLRSTQLSLTRDDKKVLHTNDRFRELDEAEIANTRAEKESFLDLAMRYYLQSLKQCEENNLSVFRVISLWFDNPNFELQDPDGDSFEDLLRAIPSRKFITVLPQLAPRLSNDSSPFADKLRNIIVRCATEHPYHTLPILFSLMNSDKDKRILNASETSKKFQSHRAQEPRVIAAEKMIKQLAERNDNLTLIISQMDEMCNAIISFANYVPKTKEIKQNIPSAELIHRLGHLNAIPIPTANVTIKDDCNYSYITSLVSFEKYFELVGGINCPKKISCRGSDGVKRILLIKGEDDLRQDAVMQQVFNIVNTLLEKNPVTNSNKLLIRTYKVVPMSRQSGVLEWCEGTMPLGSYLVGSNGAHARYRPKDITQQAARAKMTACHEGRKTNKEKLAVFLRILNDFRPVFHYFFAENYLDPITWYERRLAYTKSVATSSMVGYIMGLGDRHVQNILIDKKTAEVVHIDFGIAFDQGRALPTPETVPFRLTQDMIAGFGSSGVEGIFRKCCEKTMQLLRDNQETLLTILEVLLYDPLYSWTVTTQQTSRNNNVNCPTGSVGGLAERALLTVSSKLSGTEGGIAGGVAVPGQVARLIHTATDPANLCRLFPGWQPYL